MAKVEVHKKDGTIQHYRTDSPKFYLDHAREGDEEALRELLDLCRLEAPHSFERMGGIHVVARNENNKPIGYLWAHAYKGSDMAFMDYFAVHPDYRGDVGKNRIALLLIRAVWEQLYEIGVANYFAIVPPYLKAVVKVHTSLGGKNCGKYTVIRGITEFEGKEEKE